MHGQGYVFVWSRKDADTLTQFINYLTQFINYLSTVTHACVKLSTKRCLWKIYISLLFTAKPFLLIIYFKMHIDWSRTKHVSMIIIKTKTLIEETKLFELRQDYKQLALT